MLLNTQVAPYTLLDVVTTPAAGEACPSWLSLGACGGMVANIHTQEIYMHRRTIYLNLCIYLSRFTPSASASWNTPRPEGALVDVLLPESARAGLSPQGGDAVLLLGKLADGVFDGPPAHTLHIKHYKIRTLCI